jgi:hypothetical protein
MLKGNLVDNGLAVRTTMVLEQFRRRTAVLGRHQRERVLLLPSRRQRIV